mgnify:CR=1 FL=1
MKDEALKLKDKAKKAGKDAIEYSATKMADSKMTLKTVEDFEKFRETSKNTKWTDSTTGKKKEFSHRSIVIFSDTKSTFFKEMLYKLPVLQTKAFTQGVKLKLADISMKWLDKEKFSIHNTPSLVVFENEKLLKTLQGEENIQKVVKSMSLDINTTIDSL